MAENPFYKRKGLSALLTSNGMKAKYFQSLLLSVGMPIMVGTGAQVPLVSIERQRLPWCKEEGRPCALLMLTSSHETSLVSTTEEKHGRGSTEYFKAAGQEICEAYGDHMKCVPVCIFLYLVAQANARGHKLFYIHVCAETEHYRTRYRQAIKSHFFLILYMTLLSLGDLISPYPYQATSVY